MGKLCPKKRKRAFAMYRIEQRLGKYYVCQYRQKGPFIQLVHFDGPFCKLQAEQTLGSKLETRTTKNLEGYSHVKNRNS